MLMKGHLTYRAVKRVIRFESLWIHSESPADQNSDVSTAICLKEANNDEYILTSMGTQSGLSFQGLLNTIIHKSRIKARGE